MRHTKWLRLHQLFAAAAILVACPVVTPTLAVDAGQQWEELSQQEFQAYSRGDYRRALSLAEKAYTMASRNFGDRDRRTIKSLISFSLLYQLQGRYNEAEPLMKLALQASRETLGPHHPDTLNSLSNLATLYGYQGRYGEAETLMKEALQARREALGPRDPQTLTSLHNLASLFAYQGRYGEAEPLMKEALRARREALGPRHPHTLGSLSGLASIYKVQGRFGEAELLYQEALQGRRDALGPNHPDTLTTIASLAHLFAHQGRYGEAEPLYQEALQARRKTLGPRHPETLASLGNLAFLFGLQGRFGEAEPLMKEALQARRETLGPRHPETLASLNSLAELYWSQGRFEEAEPFMKEALQARRETLGPNHPITLRSLNSLARLYSDQGRYSEAEPLFRKALKIRRETLGSHHPDTLESLNSLAELYRFQGRHGDAESASKEALKGRRDVLGPNHPDTLRTLNSLASLYLIQGRYGEAEPLYQEALQARRETLGPLHPQTLISLADLALLYYYQGRFGEAEHLYQEVIQANRKTRGLRHPDALVTLQNLALVYYSQGRYGEAELLHLETLKITRETLGPRHPDTLGSLNNLAGVYEAQGRYDEAEMLMKEALQGRLATLGPRHPATLRSHLNMVFLLVNQGRPHEAVLTLQAMEPNILGWIGQELRSTEASAVRRRLASSPANFLDVVLTLAITVESPGARHLAAATMLHFKQIQGEQEAYLARLVRQSADQNVRNLAQTIANLRSRLSALTNAGQHDAATKLLAKLEAKEQQLLRASPQFGQELLVQKADLEKVRAALPPHGGLVEAQQYRPVDFGTKSLGEPHWAILLQIGPQEPVIVDAGPVSETAKLLPVVWANGSRADGDKAAATLYAALFGPLEAKLAGLKTVYLVPDGILNLVPFSRLRLSDGRYWEERQEVRLLNTGRDLLRMEPKQPARGLLALGGIDFGAGFPPLPGTRQEVERVAATYERLRKGEPVEIWMGKGASEARLRARRTPPRVLHLATHSFYIPRQDPADRPLALGGVALAGANRALASGDDDGILYGLEVQDLGLDGTELVVLSACKTAQGSIDYGEGVYGLARALRIAGARQVLVTLWPVHDFEARDFMISFYKTWLSQTGRSDPAAAIRTTRLAYINSPDPRLQNPRVWAPYVLIGG